MAEIFYMRRGLLSPRIETSTTEGLFFSILHCAKWWSPFLSPFILHEQATIAEKVAFLFYHFIAFYMKFSVK